MARSASSSAMASSRARISSNSPAMLSLRPAPGCEPPTQSRRAHGPVSRPGAPPACHPPPGAWRNRGSRKPPRLLRCVGERHLEVADGGCVLRSQDRVGPSGAAAEIVVVGGVTTSTYRPSSSRATAAVDGASQHVALVAGLGDHHRGSEALPSHRWRQPVGVVEQERADVTVRPSQVAHRSGAAGFRPASMMAAQHTRRHRISRAVRAGVRPPGGPAGGRRDRPARGASARAPQQPASGCSRTPNPAAPSTYTAAACTSRWAASMTQPVNSTTSSPVERSGAAQAAAVAGSPAAHVRRTRAVGQPPWRTLRHGPGGGCHERGDPETLPPGYAAGPRTRGEAGGRGIQQFPVVDVRRAARSRTPCTHAGIDRISTTPSSIGAPLRLDVSHDVDAPAGRAGLLARGSPGGTVRQTQPALHAGGEGIVVDVEGLFRHRWFTVRALLRSSGDRPGLSRPSGSNRSFTVTVQVPEPSGHRAGRVGGVQHARLRSRARTAPEGEAQWPVADRPAAVHAVAVGGQRWWSGVVRSHPAPSRCRHCSTTSSG